jgi:hypothetical protein
MTHFAHPLAARALAGFTFRGLTFSWWDLGLLLGVSIVGTLVAYLRHPEHKALMLMLPIPFTFAALGLGRPIDGTNVLGLCLLILYGTCVWALHARLRVPIIVAILASVTVFCVIGGSVARVMPASDRAFWLSVAFAAVTCVALRQVLPHRAEPEHRSPLPLWVKFPTIVAVIGAVILLKKQLGGFVTAFPMVGVVTSYEARFSLWTLVRRYPSLVLVMLPTLVVIRLTQGHIGLPAAIAAGWAIWAVSLAAMLWLNRHPPTGHRAQDFLLEEDEDDPNAGQSTPASAAALLKSAPEVLP